MLDQKQFKETFDTLHASEDTLAEVLKMTTKRKQTIRPLRIVAIAAAITIFMATIVGAYVGFTQYENPIAMLSAFFGENGAASSNGIVQYDEDGKLSVNQPGWSRIPMDETLAEDMLSSYVSGAAAAITWEDYTLTIEATLYDSLTGAGLIYYTLEHPDGIDGYSVWATGELIWGYEGECVSPMLSAPDRAYVDETMTTETKLYICQYFVISPYDAPDQLALSLGRHFIDTDGSSEYETLDTITLELTDGGGMTGLVLENGTVTVSPIGIRIKEEALGFDRAGYIHNIVLRYQDGSEYILLDDDGFLDNRMYSLGGDFSEAYASVHLFNRLVDINNLSEIVLDDLTIQIP